MVFIYQSNKYLLDNILITKDDNKLIDEYEYVMYGKIFKIEGKTNTDM